jgi:hypothetical protein
MRGDETAEGEKETFMIADPADDGLEYAVEVKAVGMGEED